MTHPRVILHIDIDYFYAQVEEVLNPELKDKPFGIQQGMNIVTCNYIARSFGIKKWRPVKEGLEKCPELVLVNGEDLSNYKVYSKKMTELLHSMVGQTERMGLDEHFIDITRQVEDEISKLTVEEQGNLRFEGPFYPSEAAFTECRCGCQQRLMLGSKMAQKLRAKLMEDLKLTCSVGIAHNKLLAKLCGQLNKPNNQTVLAPTSATMFMGELKDLRSITGIGGRTASRIEELGVTSVKQLQDSPMDQLQKKFGADMATKLKKMSLGNDSNDVKPTGKPKTVGLEDSCRPFTVRTEAEEMFRDLLPRLIWQIRNDLRIPLSMRVTVRTYDIDKKLSHKETRQFSLAASFFRFVEDELQLADGAEDKIQRSVMSHFDNIVSSKGKYFVNLVGLCFCKFQEQKRGAGAITNFLKKSEEASEGSSHIEDEVEDDREFEEKIEKFEEFDDETDFPEASFDHEDSEPPAKRIKVEEVPESFNLPPSSSEIDPSVWAALPPEIQLELMRSWKQPEPQSSSVPLRVQPKTSSSSTKTQKKSKITKSGKRKADDIRKHLTKL